jgi:3-oxo-5-alpha-steroid 4-dehydrogenase 1
MSPIHVLVWLFAIVFQVINGLSIGGYLGGYGPTSRAEWAGFKLDYIAGGRMELGMMIWALGFMANIFHDEELREIRRQANRGAERRAKEKGESVKGAEKVYMIPQNGLYELILYPHYLCEWIEWGGFWLMGGSACVPARNFVLNEIATMLPRALKGRQWYVQRFGKEKVGGRKAIIPGIL